MISKSDKPTNEYRQSLVTHEHMHNRYEGLALQMGEIENFPPEEELITFLLDLRRTFPMMFSVEQRQDYREWLRKVAGEINWNYRKKFGRDSVYADNYVGIFGNEVKVRGFIGFDFFDEDCLDRRHQEIMNLNSLRSMADAVDKLNEKNSGGEN